MTPWESLLFSIHQCYSSETTKRGRETEIKSEKEGRGGYILCISIISPPPLQEIFFFINTRRRGGGGRENFEVFNLKR